MTAVKVEEMPSQMLATEVFRRGWAKHYGIARNYRGKLKNAVAHLRVKRHAQVSEMWQSGGGGDC